MKDRRVLLARLFALAATVAVSAPLVLATPGTAYADSTVLVAPSLTLTMTKNSIGTHVCFSGTSNAAGDWSMGINGVRVDDSLMLPSQISFGAALPSSTSFLQCTDVAKNSYASGTFYVYGAFLGGSNSTFTVRPGSLSGVTIWSPAGDDIHLETVGG